MTTKQDFDATAQQIFHGIGGYGSSCTTENDRVISFKIISPEQWVIVQQFDQHRPIEGQIYEALGRLVAAINKAKNADDQPA